MGQLVSFVCLTLAKDRFSFLSLKSQDRSRCLKLFLAEPLAQTPGTCEMGVGQRGGPNTGLTGKQHPHRLARVPVAPFLLDGGVSTFYFHRLLTPGHPGAVVTSVASGG